MKGLNPSLWTLDLTAADDRGRACLVGDQDHVYARVCAAGAERRRIANEKHRAWLQEKIKCN